MNPALRPCGNPECRICKWREEEMRDLGYAESGHPEEDPLVQLALGVAAIVLIAIVFFVFLPVLT